METYIFSDGPSEKVISRRIGFGIVQQIEIYDHKIAAGQTRKSYEA